MKLLQSIKKFFEEFNRPFNIEKGQVDATQSGVRKAWYQKWWGILLIAVVTIISVVAMVDDSQNQKSAELHYEKALSLVDKGDIEGALVEIEKSKELNDTFSTNPSYSLLTKIEKAKSDEFIKKVLSEMSDAEFASLEKGELAVSYFDNEALNKSFIKTLEENKEERAKYLAEKKREEEEKKKEERQQMLEEQFSAWDGSHKNLTELIKDNMNDPGSYEHDETVYWDNGDHLVVRTTFRGNNAFGALIKSSVKAKVSLNGEVLEIIEQY